jgi:Transposase DDE domain group 1
MGKREDKAREDRTEKALFELEQERAKRAEAMGRGSRRQGALPFQYEAEPDGDEVTSWAGLPLIVEMMKRLGVETSAETLDERQRDAGFTAFEVLTAFVLLMAAGGECLDDIAMLRQDKALCALLGHGLPSAEKLRSTLETFHDPALLAQRADQAGKAWIVPESERLAALAELGVKFVHAVAKNEPTPVTRATVDHDASVIEAHKKEALAHYKGGRGYQPSVAMWAEMGLVLADEFRDGNVPAGMNNLPLIERAFAVLPPSVTERFFRADSACYDEKVLKWLAEPSRGIGFAISADMTKELRSACVALAADAWTLYEQRADMTVDVAEVELVTGTWPKDAAPLRYLTLRMTPLQGSLFADGSSVRYFAVVTNRTGDAAEIVDWHRQKAGTIEAVHDVTKNELGAGVLPSGKFGANAAWYRLSLFTHNVLVAMKRLVLPPDLNKARPKRLRLRVLALPAKVITHARGIVARVAKWLLDAADAIGVRGRILALVPS